MGTWPRFVLVTVLGWSVYVLVAAAALVADQAGNGTVGAWMAIIGIYSVTTWPWVLLTTAVFIWVPRFLSGERHYLKNLINTAAFTAAVAVFYIPLAGTLNRIVFGASINDVAVSIRSVSAFNWFWDATLFLVLLGIAYAWSYYNRYTNENRRAAELAIRNERLGAELVKLELDVLRAQLEPHFLFNALNSISALIRASKPDAATEALASLSDLLRYAIESGQKSTVTLAEDVAAIEEYLRLQKLRFGDRLIYSIEIGEDTSDIQIPPMLLQPLLENAVGHGLRDSMEPATIRLHTNYADGVLHICVENTITPTAQLEASAGFGVGLANIERRLACLFPDQHTFETQVDGERFIACVSLSGTAAGEGDGHSD